MALEFVNDFDRRALLQEIGRTPARTNAPPSSADRAYEGGSATFDEMRRGRTSGPIYAGPTAIAPIPGATDEIRRQAPAAAAPAASGYGQHRGLLEGFDAGKMDAGHVSPKYVYARYASHYAPGQLVSDANARAELAQRLKDDPSGFFAGGVEFAGPKFDRLKILGNLHPKFEGIGEFDVIRAAGEGGKAHQWGAITGGTAGVTGRGVGHAALRVPQDQGSAYERIMAIINGQQGGGEQMLDDNALRVLLDGDDQNRLRAM